MSETKLSGIRFSIHPLFWLVVGLALAAGYFLETITLFAIVIIHELGHIACARELGWHIQEIRLLPFGGIAAMEEAAGADPLDEIVIALAGPFMNVSMVAVSLFLWKAGIWSDEWTRFFMTSNWLIAGFNLLPVWPLDGGRILQSLLCYCLAYRAAVRASLALGCLLAGTMLGLGLKELHLQLVVISAYLAVLNVVEFLRFPLQFVRFLLGKHAGGTAVARIRRVTVEPTVTLLEAAQTLRKGRYHLFHVSGKGMIDERRLLHGLLFEHKHREPIGRLF